MSATSQAGAGPCGTAMAAGVFGYVLRPSVFVDDPAFGGPRLDRLYVTTIAPATPAPGYDPELAGADGGEVEGVAGAVEHGELLGDLIVGVVVELGADDGILERGDVDGGLE